MAREMYKRRRYCRFSAEGIKQVDYKDVDLLKDFISENAKIIPARMTGTKARYQRQLTTAVKLARFLALLPQRQLTTAVKLARFLALLPYTDKHQ
ncbi:MAG: hypothetical protein RL667_1151 [Pseudomonadota bacterium]